MDLSSMPVEDGYDGPMMEGAGPPVHPPALARQLLLQHLAGCLVHAHCI